MTTATTIPPPTSSPRPTPPGSPSLPGPQPYRWTIAAYRRLRDTGLFHDMKTMLIEGEILTMTMPSPPHDTALTLAFQCLLAICPTGHYVRNQQRLDVGTRNDPGPDLAVVRGTARDYASHTPTTAAMVVEVADSSLFLDTTTKAELYATAGIPEYWVIDLEGKRLLVFRDPAALPVGLGTTAYRTHLTLGPTEIIAPLVAPDAKVRVCDLLP
jgi:Uma2 family endonuclease